MSVRLHAFRDVEHRTESMSEIEYDPKRDGGVVGDPGGPNQHRHKDDQNK
jgi:hypothetical protein